MKISLRKYKISDLHRHMELLGSNGIRTSKTKEKIWLEKAIKNYQEDVPKFYVLAILLGDKVLGNVIAEKIHPNKNIHMGYWIGKDYWDKGYTTKAGNLFVDYIKEKFKIKKILASCKKDNLASVNLLHRLDFKIVRERNDKIYFEGRLK